MCSENPGEVRKNKNQTEAKGNNGNDNQELLDTLNEAKEKITEYQEFIDELKNGPRVIGTVIEIDKESKQILISSARSGIAVTKMTDLAVDGKEINPGAVVYLDPMTMGVIGFDETIQNQGPICVVVGKQKNNLVEVEVDGKTRIVRTAINAKQGHKAILDFSGEIIVAEAEDKVIKKSDNIVNVSWEEIGGLEKVKEEVDDAILAPIKHAKLYAQYGRRPPKGILLYGPPGCGKTLVGKAIATSVAASHNGSHRESSESQSGMFLYQKASEFFQKYVGVGESKIRQLFATAMEHKQKTNNQAVIFIDEAEVVMRKRGTGISTDVTDHLVATFLAEMDGLESSGAILLLATNRPDIIDPAIVREGRIDIKIEIPRPNREQAKKIFEIYIRQTRASSSHEEIIETGLSLLFDKIKGACDRVSGAMIEAIVQHSSKIAMYNDIALQKTKASGITHKDVAIAIESILRHDMTFDKQFI